MRRISAGLRTFLLLAVALTVAAHPLIRSFSLAHLAVKDLAAEAQMVICTSHGSIVVEEPSENAPSKENPSCPWCAIAAGPAGQLPALSTGQLASFDLPVLVEHRLVASIATLSSGLADWPAHAPRGPPRA